MDPHQQFCHNPACPASGVIGQGHIRIHSRQPLRYPCKRCRQTFTARRGTPLDRLHTAAALVALVLTLLTHGCPVPALVAACGLDERTVAAWLTRAGVAAQTVHDPLVHQRRLDLGHVQADEIWVKLRGAKVWMAWALAVPTRLWLGGEVRETRNLCLITALIMRVRAGAAVTAVLICVDGLASYVTAVRAVFRQPVRPGRPGRPRRVAAAGVLLGQVIKRRVQQRLVAVERRIVAGSKGAIIRVLAETGTGSGVNTAYIERLNATFRGAVAPLTRRGRRLVARPRQVRAARWLVGTAYNFCGDHRALQQGGGGERPVTADRADAGDGSRVDRPPLDDGRVAAVSGAPPPWGPPKRRGRPPKQAVVGVAP